MKTPTWLDDTDYQELYDELGVDILDILVDIDDEDEDEEC